MCHVGYVLWAQEWAAQEARVLINRVVLKLIEIDLWNYLVHEAVYIE